MNQRSPGRRSARAAWSAGAVGLATLALAACAESSASSTSLAPMTPSAAAAVSSTSVETTTTIAATTSTAAPAAAVDAGQTLLSGLDALSSTYHFLSTVTVDGAAVLVAEGDRVADGSRLTLTSSSGVVSYVITPKGSWAMPEGGTWRQLDADPADVDTIVALRSPAAVRVESNAGGTVGLTATVPRSALGIAGDGTADLAVVVGGGVLRSISYSTTVDGKPANVTSTFAPAQDPSPVTAPA